MHRHRFGWRRSTTLAALSLLAVAAGCGGGNPVTGKVTFEDGTPLDRGTVVAEAQDPKDDKRRILGQGYIRPDGTYTLGTDRPGNGVPAASYRVLVLPPDLTDRQREMGMKDPISRKWAKFETSGLTLDVKEGQNEFNITVTKPGPKEKQPTFAKSEPP